LIWISLIKDNSQFPKTLSQEKGSRQGKGQVQSSQKLKIAFQKTKLKISKRESYNLTTFCRWKAEALPLFQAQNHSQYK